MDSLLWGKKIYMYIKLSVFFWAVRHHQKRFRKPFQGQACNAKYDGTVFGFESPNISSTSCKLAMIESGHKQYNTLWKKERNLRETEAMKTEAKLFFTQTGECSLRYLVFISQTIAVKGTCIASITPPLRKKQPMQSCESLSLKKTKAQRVHYVLYATNRYICSGVSL